MASVGFRWLDILEKEFDKAFVDLDLAIGELDSEEPDVVFNVRQKLCSLSSCFAQLTHKAQTIFQNSAKIEAELIHMRAELVESKAKREVLEQELHNLLLQLHSSQLSQLPDSLGNRKQDANFKPDVNNIKKKLEAELRQSPIRNIRKIKSIGVRSGNVAASVLAPHDLPSNLDTVGLKLPPHPLQNGLELHHAGTSDVLHFVEASLSKNSVNKESEELKFSPTLMESAQCRAENEQLQLENAALRKSILSLNSEVYGAKLAAKYLDKELAGRIQQLQLLGREMRGDIRDKLWRQLESEILLQRHKTVVRACRRNSILNNSEKTCPKPPEIDPINERTEHFGDIRTVVVKRSPSQGLGISITGGREHGVPILISELEPNGPAALSEQLYIGDAILSVNDRDLRQACHREAVDILQQQTGDCTLQVQYIAADDSDTSLEEDGYNFRFFDGEVCDSNSHTNMNPSNSLDMLNTPTAPRTPESSSAASRIASRNSVPNSPVNHKVQKLIVLEETEDFDYNLNTNGNVEIYKATATKDIKIADDLNCNTNQTTEIISNEVDTTDLVLFDNATNNVIKLEDFKKVDIIDDENFNCSTNSLNSENFSSPMQTSADVFLDSEVLSTDVASNDSQSPKNIQADSASKPSFTYQEPKFCLKKSQIYTSNESLSNPKSDQSLLNSGESCGSSPIHKTSNRDYKKVQRKHKKKYFGVKTLQSIFNKHDGYSDISSTASEFGDELLEINKTLDNKNEAKEKESSKCNAVCDTTPQFEENIHNILSDIFVKSFTLENGVSSISLSKPLGTKKYFSLHGQNLRVGKALRLCPNEDFTEQVENEQRKEKLLARYVYNANSINADGVGDPDFGTPV